MRVFLIAWSILVQLSTGLTSMTSWLGCQDDRCEIHDVGNHPPEGSALSQPNNVVPPPRRAGKAQCITVCHDPMDASTSESVTASSPATQPRTPPPTQTIQRKRSNKRARRVLPQMTIGIERPMPKSTSLRSP